MRSQTQSADNDSLITSICWRTLNSKIFGENMICEHNWTNHLFRILACFLNTNSSGWVTTRVTPNRPADVYKRSSSAGSFSGPAGSVFSHSQPKNFKTSLNKDNQRMRTIPDSDLICKESKPYNHWTIHTPTERNKRALPDSGLSRKVRRPYNRPVDHSYAYTRRIRDKLHQQMFSIARASQWPHQRPITCKQWNWPENKI